MFPLMPQVQLALHRQLWVREFAFCFLGHVLEWGLRRTSILVCFGWPDKKRR